MICPKCGMFNPDGTPACESCGEQFISQEELANQEKQFENQPSVQKPTKYCINCGALIDINAARCLKCGAMQNAPVKPAVKDSGSVGWWFLGFLFPVIGFILYLCWNSTKPRSAKKAGSGALVSVIINIILFIIGFIGGLTGTITPPVANIPGVANIANAQSAKTDAKNALTTILAENADNGFALPSGTYFVVEKVYKYYIFVYDGNGLGDDISNATTYYYTYIPYDYKELSSRGIPSNVKIYVPSN